MDKNNLGQPVGALVADWVPPPAPPRLVLHGHYCRIEPIQPEQHAQDLYEANAHDSEGRLWTYLPYGPFNTPQDYVAWMQKTCLGNDPQFYAIVDNATNKAAGVASYLRVQPNIGTIEVGHICFSPVCQRTPVASEAMYLMAKQVFALGYRRYEWKCDALNAPSRAAAQRFGFSFEGVWRQAALVKNRNRDTAWYAMIDHDWAELDAVFAQWLSPANFDAQGRQRVSLSALTQPILKALG